MASAVDDEKLNETLVYRFRFADADQVLSFTQEQLECIPYLNALISNADNFSCSRSEDNAFVLSRQIQYTFFNPIYSAIVNKQPSHLFTKLPRDADSFCVLDLYDYLCIDPLPIPSLKPISEMMKENRALFYEQYYKATPSEARDTAVEFLVAIVNRKYNFNNRETVKIVFDLLIDILSSISVFDHRLRYQTLVVIENCCYDLFTSLQHDLLRTYKRSLEILNDSSVDLDGGNQMLEAPETHFFYWRKRSCPITCKNTFSSPSSTKKYTSSLSYLTHILFIEDSFIRVHRSFLYDHLRPMERSLCARCYERYNRNEDISYNWCFGYDISCSCGYLNRWFERSQIAYFIRRDFGCLFNHEYSCQLANMDTQLAMCLINCCSKPQRTKQKRERQYLYSERAHYLLSMPSVDKI